MTKICKQCGISNKEKYFHGRLCTTCNNRNNLIKRCAKLGIPVPPLRFVTVKICKQCNFSGDKTLFHGKICIECFNNNRFVNATKDDIKIRNRKYKQKSYDNRKNDILFKFRLQLSGSIRRQLKKNNGSKNNESILQFLSYSIQELKNHLEAQFKPWMTWENHGKYNKKNWDDNDPTTWTWNIDHIIPQHKLPYIRMTDDNFKKCWALENLRPLSAKINIIKGYR
jgi:hypothetical protein